MKYRIYNKKENKYCEYYDFFVSPKGEIFVIYNDGCELDIYEAPNQEYFVIEQCTNEKDINGKLIFENDVIKQRDGRTGKVVFRLESEGWDYNGWAMEEELIGDSLSGAEIVGTIHN